MKTSTEQTDELHNYQEKTIVVNDKNAEMICEFLNKARNHSEFLSARMYDGDFFLVLQTSKLIGALSIEFQFKERPDVPLSVGLQIEPIKLPREPYLKFSRPLQPWATQRLIHESVENITIQILNEQPIRFKPLGVYDLLFKEVWSTLAMNAVKL